MKNKKDRLSEIINVLRIKGSTNLQELAEKFQVSTATIRRDIKSLERSGQVVQTLGGGIIYQRDYSGPSQTISLSAAIEEKVRIAEFCSSLVNEKETILIGPGVVTTLAGKIMGGLEIHFRVLTNSLSLAQELAKLENIHTVILGGEIHNGYSASIDTDISGLNGIQYADRLFLTADGIDLEYGLTYFGTSLIPIIRKMMDISKEIILIADSTKFEKICFNSLEGFERIDRIITDDKLKKNIRKALADRNIQLTIV